MLPTTTAPGPYYVSYVFPAELRLALRELKFEIADKAPIMVQVVIRKHSECGDLCFGKTTEADLVFTDLASSDTQTIRIRVGDGTQIDRMPPLPIYLPSLEDWEVFAYTQNSMGGTRYRNFHQRLLREIRQLM